MDPSQRMKVISTTSTVATTSPKKPPPIHVRKLVTSSLESLRLVQSFAAPATVDVTR
jgi:hypothetical protein